MGEKDISENYLEAYNDVFADIINVLLCNGKQVIKQGKHSYMSTTKWKSPHFAGIEMIFGNIFEPWKFMIFYNDLDILIELGQTREADYQESLDFYHLNV